MYRLNDGILEIYIKVSDATTAAGSSSRAMKFVRKVWYADLGISTTEYYDAEMAESFIERRVRIRMDKSLTRQNIIIIDGKQYQVGRVWSGRLNRLNKTYDEFALGAEFTDITLEGVDKYAVIEI